LRCTQVLQSSGTGTYQYQSSITAAAPSSPVTAEVGAAGSHV
jgi:hypothetical protein